jgi:hypothetical protein
LVIVIALRGGPNVVTVAEDMPARDLLATE